jgi:hypothetical protein
MAESYLAHESDRIPAELRRGLYKTIFRRRDIREFLPDPIPDEVLARVLVAAHPPRGQRGLHAALEVPDCQGPAPSPPHQEGF